MDQIEKSTKSLPPISENLSQAYTRTQLVQAHIPHLTSETEAAERSFTRGHEKVSSLSLFSPTCSVVGLTYLGPPSRYRPIHPYRTLDNQTHAYTPTRSPAGQIHNRYGRSAPCALPFAIGRREMGCCMGWVGYFEKICRGKEAACASTPRTRAAHLVYPDLDHTRCGIPVVNYCICGSIIYLAFGRSSAYSAKRLCASHTPSPLSNSVSFRFWKFTPTESPRSLINPPSYVNSHRDAYDHAAVYCFVNYYIVFNIAPITSFPSIQFTYPLNGNPQTSQSVLPGVFTNVQCGHGRASEIVSSRSSGGISNGESGRGPWPVVWADAKQRRISWTWVGMH